jgi:hypothetical protein
MSPLDGYSDRLFSERLRGYERKVGYSTIEFYRRFRSSMKIDDYFATTPRTILTASHFHIINTLGRKTVKRST